MQNKWLDGLNKEQQQAVLHDYGPLLILAGAGSGKTTTLVSRTGRLIAEKIAKPKEICILTFTNKAARELKERVELKLGKDLKGLWAGTFHSYGLEILRRHYDVLELSKYFGIMDQQDANAMVRELLFHTNFAGKKDFDTQTILAMISRWRENNQRTARNEADEYEQIVEWILPKYEKKKKLMGVVDFDDLIIQPVRIFKKHPEILQQEQQRFTQMMVDEFQDTNIAQMKLVQMLTQKHQNLTVVGDDDQSIYGWRGACVENILNFPKKHKKCKVIRLEKNYRSTDKILNLANTIIAQNKDRYDKVLVPTQGDALCKHPELFVFESDEEEMEGVIRELHHFKNTRFEWKDMAILYRSNGQGALLEMELKSNNIPYSISGNTGFLDRREVKDALCYLKCAFRLNDMAFRRIFNVPSRGLGETTFEQIHDSSQKLKISFFKATQNYSKMNANKQATSIQDLLNSLKSLKTRVLSPQAITPGQELVQFFKDIGYKKHLEKSSKDLEKAYKRWRWIEILGDVFDKFMSNGKLNQKNIQEFISFMELRDTDQEDKNKNDGLKLMTLHASKGLEFPLVILMGLEEDILPHKSLGGDISEERRLFYVGVTRAQRHLILTRSKNRRVNGQMKPRTPSRFITQLPKGIMEIHESGFRPISQNERKSMMGDLFTKLDSNTKNIQ